MTVRIKPQWIVGSKKIEPPKVKLKKKWILPEDPKVVTSFDPMAVTYHRKQPKVDPTQRLGSKAPHDVIHNCLTCARWVSCHDNAKSLNYRCTRFREATIDATTLEEMFADMPSMEENTVKEEDFYKTSDDEETIEEMIAKVINSNVPVPPDLRINDTEIQSAKNFFEWISSDKFAKSGNPPFPRQVEIGLKLFAEFCPRCSDMEWFDGMPVDAPLTEIQDRVVALEHGICPKCHGTKSEFVLGNEVNDYYGIVGLVGQRGSKTTSMILWDTYNLHKTVKLPSPQTAFGTLSTQVIASTFTAITFQQAVENIWNPYLNTLKTIPWFDNYHKFLDRKGEELGEELYNLGEHMVRYRHRNLLLSPSGPSKRTLRGRTRLSAATDEIGWMPLAKKSGKIGDELERLDARGVFTALNNSLFTLKSAHRRRVEEGYNDMPKPVMYAISSPSQYNDFIMTSFRTYQGSSEMYAFKYATWEFNPLLKKRDFKEEFRLKPVDAARDYECNPPIGEGLFINEHGPLIKSFRSGPNKISVLTSKALSKTGVKMTNSKVQITSNRFPMYGTILCVDVGLVNNSFSWVIIGPADDYDIDLLPEDRGTMQTPVKVWAAGEVIPKADTRISLTSVYTDCFLPLIEPFNIRYMVSDRWQNAKIAQDLEESYEVTPLEYRATWEDFEATRDLLYSNNLIMPKMSQPLDDVLKTTLDNYPEVFRNRPIDHMAWQFATVRESTGVTVLKGDGGTDDLFRCVVLGVANMQNEEILEDLLSVAHPHVEPQQFLGMVVKMSGKAGVQNNSGATSISAVRRLRGVN